MTFTLIIKWKSLWQSLYPRSNHCPKIWLIFWLIFNLINWSTCRFKPSLRPSCSHFLVLLWRHLLSFFAQTFHMKKKRKRNCWLCRIWCWEKAALLLFWIEVGLSQLLHCQQIHRQTTMVVRNGRHTSVLHNNISSNGWQAHYLIICLSAPRAVWQTRCKL